MTTGLGFASTPWWQQLISAGTDIARSRFGNPPPGTVITTPSGTIVRQAPNYPVGTGITVGSTSEGLSPLLLIGGVVLIAVLASKK